MCELSVNGSVAQTSSPHSAIHKAANTNSVKAARILVNTSTATLLVRDQLFR